MTVRRCWCGKGYILFDGDIDVDCGSHDYDDLVMEIERLKKRLLETTDQFAEFMIQSDSQITDLCSRVEDLVVAYKKYRKDHHDHLLDEDEKA